MAKQLTREEAIEALFHELRGRLLEVMIKQYTDPSSMSMYLKGMGDKLFRRIAEILDEFKPPPSPTEQAKTDPVKAAPPPQHRR